MGNKDASRLLLKLAFDLFENEDEREEFLDAMIAGESKEQAIVAMQDRVEFVAFPRKRPLKWQLPFVHRIDDSFKPSKHPLYEKGAFYSMDFSSAFVATAMMGIKTPVKRVLDLCSSPGGKAIFSWRMFKPELLLCNEIMRKRVSTLIGNLDRCKCENSAVWSADPSVFARKFKECFDLVICDAPCSGQSLVAKGEEAPECFDPNSIDMNVGRQRRILGNAYHCLVPGGHLLYSTCTYTTKENERVIDWFLKTHPDLEAVEIKQLAEFRSKYTDTPSYRIFPHQGLGAGAYVCLIQRKGEKPEVHKPIDHLNFMWKYGDEVYVKKEPEPPEESAAAKAHREQPLSARQMVKKMNADKPRKPLVKKPRKRRK